MLASMAWLWFGPMQEDDYEGDGGPMMGMVFAGMFFIGAAIFALVIITIGLRKILPLQRLHVDLVKRKYHWQLLVFIPLKGSKGDLSDCIIELQEAVRQVSLPFGTVIVEDQSACFRDPKQGLLVPIYQSKGADLLDIGRQLEAVLAIPCQIGSAPILTPGRPDFPLVLQDRPPALVEVAESWIVLAGRTITFSSDIRVVVKCSGPTMSITDGRGEKVPMVVPSIDLNEVRKFAFGVGPNRSRGFLYVLLERKGWQRVFFGFDEETTRWVVNWLTARLAEFRTEHSSRESRRAL